MAIYRQKILLILVSLLLGGCGGSGNGKDTNTTSSQSFSTEEKKFVHSLFLTEYLWYEDVPQYIDYTQYNTPNSLLDDLRVYPPDRWSFALTQKDYDNLVNQKTSGFGFGYLNDFVIYTVLIDAPAWQKLQRGDKIIAINGEPVTHDRLKEASNSIGTATTFTLERNSEIINIVLTPQEYTFKVTDAKVFNHNGKTIGYLRYDSFTSTSVAEIESAFDNFKNNNIDELVVDLRYNGGGSITVASILLDNITNEYPGERQFYLDWNSNYKQNNEHYYFEEATEQDGNELKMSRVYFLVSRNSASASELVISALKPYLGNNNIITIGEYTHGKNVGMRGRVYNNNYYFLINFYVKNNDGETTGFDGIPPACIAEDDLTHQRGDINETMLQTALYYMDNGSCP
jgi:C-terminal processing protease CtpA/Prc